MGNSSKYLLVLPKASFIIVQQMYVYHLKFIKILFKCLKTQKAKFSTSENQIGIQFVLF